MQKKKMKVLLIGLLLLLFSLAWTKSKEIVFEKKITSAELGGKERYLLYASTDKPIYREGENLYLRVVGLHASDNTPIKNNRLNVSVKIRGPKGNIVYRGNATGNESTAGFKWPVPSGMSGGVYTALVASPSLGCPETKRKFEVRTYRAPRLNTQIAFIRKGYGPGDTVQGNVTISRAEGGELKNPKITAVARLDGKEIYRKDNLNLNADGSCSAKFVLPEEISVGDGNLSFIIEDGGVVETASKSLPILLQNMDLAFYPESGSLVVGLKSRVYVQALRPNGKPADIAGRIYELEKKNVLGKEITSLKTTHEGRGYFTLTPKAGLAYALVLDKPSSIERLFRLPEVRSDGGVIKSLQDVYPYEGDLSFLISSTIESKAAKISLHKRELELDSKSVSSGKESSVSLNAQDKEGVLMVTLWDSDDRPIAERLIYRKPLYEVNVQIKTDKKSYSPGDRVKLDIQTTDANGKAIEAVVGLTVSDESVLEMIDKREQAARLPVMVYLENEVLDLADAHIYLDHKNPAANESLDLLLGTQGWRRFVLKRFKAIKEEYPNKSRGILAEKMLLVYPARDKKRDNRMFFQKKAKFKNEKAKLVAKPLSKIAQVKEIQPNVIPVERKAVIREKRFRLDDMDMAEEKDMEAMADRVAWVMVREYAHKNRANRKANDRVDFTETLYWNAGIQTNSRDGKAIVEFDLSDSITSFRVMADAFGRNGALGSQDHVIRSIEPFYIEAKLPIEASVGDQIEIPISLINASADNLSLVNVIVQGANDGGLKITQINGSSLNAGERARRIIKIEANKSGRFPLRFMAAAGSYSDTLTRTLIIKPKGFPIKIHHGGLLGPNKKFTTNFSIPEEIEMGSIRAMAKVFPTPLANMEEALNALLRQPNGCFEQTSSTNYPLVMAQQYFSSHQGISAKKIAKAQSLLNAGYKKLIGFECKKNGYEWFGRGKAHEALTAYGLMEFSDMAKIMPLDKKMIQRTRKWLLSRRDGKGGFKKNKRALDSFGRAPDSTTNAYIVWSLLESGEKASTLIKEISALKELALKSEDSYVLALVANILYIAGDKPTATKISKILADAKNEKGFVDGAKTSITRSGGNALKIETTSLAILAWLRDDNKWAAEVETSMKWLFENCKSGRFGSTQSTILVLKAINTYDQTRAKPKQAGSVQLFIDGVSFGKPISFNKQTQGAIELPNFSAALSAGQHKLELRMLNGSKMPFAIELRYNTNLPVQSEECILKLKTELSSTEIKEGELLELNMILEVGAEDAPTPIAIIGLPAGLEIRHDQLKELIEEDRISSYEVKGRELILYWRALKARTKINLALSLTAAIPGFYEGPASRAYLYYTDEYKVWDKGAVIKIKAL